MAFNPEQVKAIAHLARLSVSEAEADALAGELGRILAFFDQIDQVDTAGIAPLAHPLDAVQRLRPDAVTEVDCREAYQAIAPAVERGLYLVPKVIE